MRLREAMVETIESIKPINLLKSTMKNALESSELRGGLVSAALGVTAGYLSRRLFIGSHPGPVRKLIGTLLMFGVSKVITSNSEFISKIEDKLIHLVSKKELDISDEDAAMELTYDIS